jgi:hypothetical protein
MSGVPEALPLPWEVTVATDEHVEWVLTAAEELPQADRVPPTARDIIMILICRLINIFPPDPGTFKS